MVADIMTISRLRMGTDGEGVSTLVTLIVRCAVNIASMIFAIIQEKDCAMIRSGQFIRRIS